MVSALSGPRLQRVVVRLPRWPQARAGFRIVQISDVHIGSLLRRDFAERVTRRVNALEPDLIAITGDLVDGPVSRLGEEADPFSELRARHGVYFVTGNHDYYSGDVAWAGRIAEWGVRVLRNECEEVSVGEGEGRFSFTVAGIDDYRSRRGNKREHVKTLLDGVPPERFVLLLAHDPSDFTQASESGADLQLSGHTHGGQIWPFRYFVRIAIPYVAGLYHRGGSKLYVSRGTGFWGPPMRLFAPAEITEIALLPELPSAPSESEAAA
jgi:predicted MPP superfamily phosphohydrolase